MSRVTIVGGGIIGLFTAYYLSDEGFEVTIVDRGDLSNSCSIGNAGMIVPSHIVPLASPGIIAKGMKWMLSSTSPFYIHPKLDLRLAQWCLLFYKAATKKHVEYSIPYLKNLSLYSKNLYVDFAGKHNSPEVGFQEKGLLMLYKSEEAAHEEVEFAHLARKHGLETEILSPDEVKQLEPHAGMDVRGGVFFPGDAHLNPSQLHAYLVRHLEQKGVKIVRHAEVLDFATSGRTVTSVITDKGEFASDQVIIAAGNWAGEVARKLKITMPMLGGKGYSFLTKNSPAIQRPAILTEARVAVTPFGDQVRFGGTMEITNDNASINLNRVKGIHNAISKYYGGFQADFPEKDKIWSGLRPCSPDGLPYIGATSRWNNVLFGTGHSMMGLSLAPATGKLLTEELMNRKSSVGIDAFSPDRYS
ncbi:NAD(P)/FAD-dependent oxidoreductase [Rufibacter sediminis]|uniref:FAD-dependent oxidoreductase n=1 Tax=Rufibacter sediminis TaxID=2762756 RepID=A0ABR6VT72_9BACT|nr:FAD-dependent oxidoreductase [Rufibacter sediminis]MBC3540129.1 FAD-dependent oxidoreductase [Rufibacter sediminis]